MIGRLELEKREYEILSDRATKAAGSKGRILPEEKCHLRTDFQRDRDRIIHSKAFRRLMHKTQVFLSPEGDHYRTRLTHTLEVAQVARTIARALALNEDLVEAISLGHDLGHTPFGHNGERVLAQLIPGGFRHNEQSLRVVDILERRGMKRGMNLTIEVRDGILNHTGNKLPMTPEGQIVKISDRIAYINHDIDDAVRSGVIKAKDLPEGPIRMFGLTHGMRIDSMISNVIENSAAGDIISMDDKHYDSLMELRSFMFENVYKSTEVKREEDMARVDTILRTLFKYYTEHPEKLPEELADIVSSEGIEVAVKDHIAGMTDRFCVNTYESIV